MAEHYQGSCHCGAVKFAYEGEKITKGLRCSCSICSRKGAMMSPEAIPQKKQRQRVIHCIGQLADNPRPAGSRKLSGYDRYRLRLGSYRIVYSIDGDELVLLVVKVGHRQDV